ncbi:hypothetical protein [Leucobacter salsicius]|uniref:hypothetical protein n=1 Tax=Leucobacter salsicius TaxID=664638 RepID=UPI00034D5710|nr:hypothetical protein [Leucobacter salsicius]
MTASSRRFSTAFATAAIVGAALLAPTAAHAADLDCASGQIAGPLQSATVKALDGATLGQMQTPLCATTGQLIPHPQFATAPGTYEVEFRPGTVGFVDEHAVTVYPAVTAAQLQAAGEYFAIAAEDDLPGGVWDKIGSASDGLFAMPGTGGPFSAGPVADGLASGTAFLSSNDPGLTAQGTAGLAGEVTWQPVVDPASGDVLWSVQEYLVPLASEGDSKRTFEVPSAGYQLYDAPTDTSAQSKLKKGDVTQATTFTAGWALSDDGWIREPAVKPAEKKDGGAATSEAWDAVKDKSKSAWDATKEKTGELTASASDKVAEKQASSKTLTFGAMVSSTILSALAAILAIAGLTIRRARGLAQATPAGIAKTAISFVAARASLVLSMAAVAIAPWAWVWPPIIAGAAALLSVAALYVYAARIRGGHAHATPEELVEGLRSPLAIAVGAAMAVVTVGGAALAGLSWPAYVAAGLGAAAIYGGLALTAKRAPEPTAPETADDTRDSETDEAPADAEPARAE